MLNYFKRQYIETTLSFAVLDDIFAISFVPQKRIGTRVSFVNGGSRSGKQVGGIKARTGSEAITQSSEQLRSIVLIAFTVAAVDRET